LAEICFQLDEHIPTAVGQALRRRGVDILSTVETGLRGATDEEQLSHAHAGARVFVTQDEDFLALHQRGQPHSGIVYARQGKRTIGQLVAGLLLIHGVLEPGEMVGRVEFLWRTSRPGRRMMAPKTFRPRSP
jgi:predicted nuclease of predicted toxin-antitoxin system